MDKLRFLLIMYEVDLHIGYNLEDGLTFYGQRSSQGLGESTSVIDHIQQYLHNGPLRQNHCY